MTTLSHRITYNIIGGTGRRLSCSITPAFGRRLSFTNITAFGRRLSCIITLVFILLTLLSTSCSSELDKQRDELVQQAKSIIHGNDSTSVRLIELTIRSIETFIDEHPELKNPEEMTSYLKELYRSLDVHRVKIYTTRFAKMASTAATDLSKIKSDLQAFADEFEVGYGAELAVRQAEIGEMLADVKKMQQEFGEMQQFYAQDFPPTLEAYNYLIGFHSPAYENSDYEAVRRSWKLLANQYRTKIAERELNEKVKNFGQYLKSDAESIANTQYKGYIVDRSRPTETLKIGRITEHATYDGRECEATFRVYLKGAFLGWNRGWTQLTVKGVLLVGLNANNEKARVEYKREDFRVEGSEF